MCRCGISRYGLVGVVLLGGWLDLMILEVFSNLKDSMILWYYVFRANQEIKSYIFEIYQTTPSLTID